MFAELGNLSLHMALIISMSATILPVLDKQKYMTHAWCVILILSAIALGSLVMCFVVSDFSVLNVVNNSHKLKPLIYKISAAWGNHEGSMLLWILAFSSLTCLFALLNDIQNKLISYTLVVQGVLNSFFIAFTVLTSNPFIRIFPPPTNGFGFNPLLQDIGLAMHPPMLYLGYVGFSLICSGSIATLITLNTDRFVHIFKPFVMLSWTFLTLGIGLGSWWAYRELGWGGFWFWDPVENSSLLPWLVATALIHSLHLQYKLNIFKSWNIILGILTFTLSMVGTFLVRSNIITSVHSFAQSPKRGMFILIFLCFFSGCAFLLYAVRSHKIKSNSVKLNRHAVYILVNNLIMLTSAFIILFGTLYPSILDICCNKKISVGAPYFNALIAPCAIVLLPLIIFGNGYNRKSVIINSIQLLTAAIITAIIFYKFKMDFDIEIVGICFGIWLIISMINANKICNRSALFAHLAFAILVISLSFNSSLQAEIEISLKQNEFYDFRQFTLKLDGVALMNGKNYIARVAKISVHSNNRYMTTLYPEVRFYPVESQQTNESAIHHCIFYDLYLSVGDIVKDRIMIRIYIKPMMSWVWMACLMLTLSGFNCLCRCFKLRRFSAINSN